MDTTFPLNRLTPSQRDILVDDAKQRAVALRREALRHFGASAAQVLRALWRRASQAWSARRSNSQQAASCPR